MALRPGSSSARFWAELVTALLASELCGFSHWDGARYTVEDTPYSIAGDLQGTQGGHLVGTGSKKAFCSRSGAAIDC